MFIPDVFVKTGGMIFSCHCAILLDNPLFNDTTSDFGPGVSGGLGCKVVGMTVNDDGPADNVICGEALCHQKEKPGTTFGFQEGEAGRLRGPDEVCRTDCSGPLFW